MASLAAIKKESYPDTPVESLQLNRLDFKKAVGEDTALLSRAFRNQFIVPEFPHFCQLVEGLYESCKQNEAGEVRRRHTFEPVVSPMSSSLCYAAGLPGRCSSDSCVLRRFTSIRSIAARSSGDRAAALWEKRSNCNSNSSLGARFEIR